jgi:hypothetical protein
MRIRGEAGAGVVCPVCNDLIVSRLPQLTESVLYGHLIDDHDVGDLVYTLTQLAVRVGGLAPIDTP